MKYNRPRNVMLWTLGPAWILICIALFVFATPALLIAYHLHWLILAIAVIICITPWARIRLKADNSEAPTLSTATWLQKIIIMQVCLFAVYIGICHLTHQNTACIATNHFYLLQLGLLPWAAIALLAISYAWVSYKQQQDAFMHSIINPLIKTGATDSVGLNANIDAKLATFAAFASTFAVIALILAHFATSKSFQIPQSPQLTAILIGFILIVVALLQPTKMFFKKVLSQRLPLFIALFALCVLFALSILVLSWLLEPLRSLKFPIILANTVQNHIGTTNLSRLFAVCWWIAWIPITSIYIARISKSRAIWQIILVTLCVPILFAISTAITLHFNVPILKFALIDNLIAIAGFIGLLYLFTSEHMLASFILSYLPKRGVIKRREHQFFLRRALQLAAFFIFLYLSSSLVGSTAMLFTMVMPISVISLVIPITVILRLVKHKESKHE